MDYDTDAAEAARIAELDAVGASDLYGSPTEEGRCGGCGIVAGRRTPGCDECRPSLQQVMSRG